MRHTAFVEVRGAAVDKVVRAGVGSWGKVGEWSAGGSGRVVGRWEGRWAVSDAGMRRSHGASCLG